MKTGRNQPCPCGSGRKYKKCCGRAIGISGKTGPALVDTVLEHQEAREQMRLEQQGRGRPIIAGQWQDWQLVAVGNSLFYSKNWKVFPDFLDDYLKHTLGADWGNAELRKPLLERHPVLQWYDACCRLLATVDRKPGEIPAVTATGAVNCYLGLSYSLYLIKHNVVLQERLIKRLKDQSNFQGAYYELIVANCLIRAGFDLTLEDETDDSTKHCEFSAVSKRTLKKYWVEAKMRGVSGLLGRKDSDGSKQEDAAATVTTHLRKALKKPATDERLVFIDVNSPPTKPGEIPTWAENAFKRLERSERDTKPKDRTYVFITNIPYHHTLEAVAGAGGILGYGYGIPDFGKRDPIRLSEAYKRKQQHIDAHYIGEALRTYPQIPTTFDGSLPSETITGSSRRVLIGQTYFFPDANQITGTVTSATVDEKQKRAYYGVTGHDGKSYLVQGAMTDEELEDYRAHKDVYFGVIQPVPRHPETPFELFEWMVNCYEKTTKEKLLELAKDAPDIDKLSALPQEELVLEVCERMVATIPSQKSVRESRGLAIWR
jgi:hypothetical protein